jgi:hypothetical protein
MSRPIRGLLVVVDNRWLCPECGATAEVDTDSLLLSNPPKHHARCPECSWKGYVWAYETEEDDA